MIFWGGVICNLIFPRLNKIEKWIVKEGAGINSILKLISINLSLLLALVLFSSSITISDVQAEPTYKENDQVTKVMGDGEAGFREGPYDIARIRFPRGITEDNDGNILIADSMNQRVRIIVEKEINTYAGDPPGYDLRGFKEGGYRDGNIDEARFNSPRDMVVDSNGDVYVSDSDNHVIRRMSKSDEDTGEVTTFVGAGEKGKEDARGLEAKFNTPSGMTVDDNDNIYVADTMNQAIRKITSTGNVNTIADGLNEPYDVAYNSETLYVSDSGAQKIYQIDLDAENDDYDLEVLAGGGEEKLPDSDYTAGDLKDGTLEEAQFNFPKGLDITKEGVILVADGWNGRVRAVFPGEGEVRTLVSEGLEGPIDVYFKEAEHENTGDLYISDMWNNIIIREEVAKKHLDPEELKKEEESLLELLSEIFTSIIDLQ